MSEASKRPDSGRRRSRSTNYTSKSGKNYTLNRSFSDRLKANRQARAAKKAEYLATLPKGRFERLAYRLHPKRLAQFWFSREGAIMALKVVGVGIIICFFLTIGLFAYFRKDLPQIKDIAGSKLGGSITYYDKTGQTVLWQDYDAIKRIPVTDENISPYMKQATVAIEDKDFYKHGAFDVRGITRAGFHDVFGGGGSVQGGSTITQQLVKLNEKWTDNRTITRKVKELILAVDLEREYSKKDILTGYLNIAPYGGVEYGVETAARDYFQTSAKDLTLAQASMLAAIPQSPSYYSPYSSPDFNSSVVADGFGRTALLNRQHYILDQMVAQGYITKDQAEQAKQVDVLAQVHPLQSKYQGIRSPYFVLAAKQALEQKFGAQTVQRGGWQVTTTLDMNLQSTAEDLVAKNYSNIQRLTGGAADEEALVAEDVQTGQIVSLVGGVDFSNKDYGQNNYAAGILIPPGSSFKPYDYTTFINNNNNVGAGSVLYDSQGPLPGYPCTNKQLPKNGGNCLEDYDFIYPGAITLRYALGGSRNVPAVKAMLSAVPNDSSSGYTKSINKVIDTASAMMANPAKKRAYNCYSDEALTQTTQCYGASAIGDGAFLHLDDHVNGLGTLARLGKAIPKTYFTKIEDASGKTIYKWTQPKGKQVIKADSAYIVNDMASDPNASYLPGSCSATTCYSGYKFHRYNGWHFAVKTGTTNDGFDGLMTSWSTKYAVVTWVGNHDRNLDLTKARGTSMEYLTEPLARGWMQAAHTNLTPVNWEKPAGIKSLPAYILRKHIHYGDVEPSPSNDLYPSWYVPKSSASNSAQTLDKVSNKLATNCTPANAKMVVGGANANSFSVDKFVSGGMNSGTSTTETDDVHKCDDIQPTVTLTVPANCQASDNGNQGCSVTATVTAGTHPLSSSQFPGTLVISVNGKEIGSYSVSDSPDTKTTFYAPTEDGQQLTFSATVTDSVLYQGSDTQTSTAVVH